MLTRCLGVMRSSSLLHQTSYYSFQFSPWLYGNEFGDSPNFVDCLLALGPIKSGQNFMPSRCLRVHLSYNIAIIHLSERSCGKSVRQNQLYCISVIPSCWGCLAHQLEDGFRRRVRLENLPILVVQQCGSGVILHPSKIRSSSPFSYICELKLVYLFV